MDEIGVNHVVLYFDPEVAEFDGLGWCVEAYPGSSTYRYETLNEATQAIRSLQDFLSPNCKEFVV